MINYNDTLIALKKEGLTKIDKRKLGVKKCLSAVNWYI